MRQVQDIVTSVDWERAMRDGTAGRIALRARMYAQAHTETWHAGRMQNDALASAFDEVSFGLWQLTRQETAPRA